MRLIDLPHRLHQWPDDLRHFGAGLVVGGGQTLEKDVLVAGEDLPSPAMAVFSNAVMDFHLSTLR